MKTLLAIAVAGGLGSVARYSIARAVQLRIPGAFPAGTLLVNVVGCLIVGIVARYFLNDETQPIVRAAIIVGFCGGFTTFSAFSLETVGLVTGGEWGRAAAYVAASLILCLAATALGYQIPLRS